MAKKPMNDASIYNPALSRRAVALLSEWERERKRVVTLQELQQIVGKAAAADTAHQLVQKHALQRLRRGSYLVRPFRALGRATEPSTAFATEALLHQEPHYLGGLWALSFHGFTEQRYATLLDAFVTHRLAPRQLGVGRGRFHVLSPEAFHYGVMTSPIEGVAVHISDPERTILDAFDYPRIFGGLGGALELFNKHFARLDRKRLLQYALAGSKPSTSQRLGVLLQRSGMSSRALSKLRVKARETQSLLSLWPDSPRKGPVNRDWNVVENDG